jgi:sugar/nucleoside kinase (ribokinase family)
LEEQLKKLHEHQQYVDALFVNKHEFSLLVNKKADMLDLKENQLTNLGIDLDMLIITDSKNGSFAYTKEKVYYEPAAKIKAIIDATGAGDAFTSAYSRKRRWGRNTNPSSTSS